MIPQLSFFWAVCVLGIELTQESLFPLCSGSVFAQSVVLCSVLLIGAAFHLVFSLHLLLFFAYDMPGASTVIVLLMTVLNILGDWCLVPRLGPMGAAVSTSAGMVFSTWLYLHWGNRRMGVGCRVALISSTVVAVSLMVMAGQSLGITLAICAVAGFLLVRWARITHIFSPNTLSFFDQVYFPRHLSSLMKKLYLVLSASCPKNVST